MPRDVRNVGQAHLNLVSVYYENQEPNGLDSLSEAFTFRFSPVEFAFVEEAIFHDSACRKIMNYISLA
jgi:hypothetical protein